MSKKYVSPSAFIYPININGLDGRVLNLKASNKNNKKEILVVYGLDSNLERWWGLDSALKQYANVTAVDLPGFGGMDDFFKIGIKPSLNNFADYLASFIKLKYKKKKFIILGIDFGFVVATRMLQRNSAILNNVSMVVGINGYAHHDDLKITKKDKYTTLAQNILLSIPLLPAAVKLALHNSQSRNYMFNKLIKSQKDPFLVNFLLDLNKETDLRTKKYITWELSKLDNCSKRLDIPFWDVSLGDTKGFLNSSIAEQHLKVVYPKYRHIKSKLIKKVPFVINTQKAGIKIVPAILRRELKKPLR